jgi:4-hydroxy-tetrahydrodipicolinate synthase
VKQADPDVGHTRRLRDLCDVAVYAGNDDMLLDVLEMGGAGGICVASHLVGPQLADMARLVRAGEHEKARIVDESLRELYRVLFITANPIPVKTALNLLDREVGGLRLPLVTATGEETAVVATELRRLGLLS